MYLVSGLSPAEIAECIGKEPRQVQNLVSKQGWPAKRRENEDKAERDVLEQGLGSAKEFVESTAINAVEMAEKGFVLARETGDAKEFADAMRGTKIAVDMTRQAMALDAGATVGALTINQFYARPAEKVVTPEPIHEAREVVLDFE